MANGCEIILNPGKHNIFWQAGKPLVIQRNELPLPEEMSQENLLISGHFSQAVKLTIDGSHLVLTPA